MAAAVAVRTNMDEPQSVIAVSAAEFRQFGCPYCGCQDGFTSFSIGGVAIWKCGSEKCGQTCCILAKGITESPIGFGGDFHRPKLQPHPLAGSRS